MSVLAERAIGVMPASIATAIAMQKLAGMQEIDGQWKHTRQTPWKQYNQLWINLQTVVRNFIGSFSQDERARIDIALGAEAIIDELNVIVDGMEIWGIELQPHVYCPMYKGLELDFPGSDLRRATTKIQISNEKVHNALLQAVLAKAKNIETFHRQINNGPYVKVLMLTHHPVDLLANRYFSETALLESHTGTIKTISSWWTKFVGEKDHSMIPFNKLTLPIMGDSEDFKPASIRTRARIHDLAVQKRWTAVTSLSRIKVDLKAMTDPAARKEIEKYL